MRWVKAGSGERLVGAARLKQECTDHNSENPVSPTHVQRPQTRARASRQPVRVRYEVCKDRLHLLVLLHHLEGGVVSD